MNEEKALKLFARCYNACDFAGVIRRLHKKASYEAYDRFYRHEGSASVARRLAQSAAELRALPERNRAYRGFMMVSRGFSPILRPEPCVMLTRSEPRNVLGVVRIKCSPLHIKEIRVLDPSKCQCTRGNYAGGEG